MKAMIINKTYEEKLQLYIDGVVPLRSLWENSPNEAWLIYKEAAPLKLTFCASPQKRPREKKTDFRRLKLEFEKKISSWKEIPVDSYIVGAQVQLKGDHWYQFLKVGLGTITYVDTDGYVRVEWSVSPPLCQHRKFYNIYTELNLMPKSQENK